MGSDSIFRISKMKFGIVLFMLWLLPQLSQQGRSSPSMTAPELLTWHQSRSHFHLTPKMLGPSSSSRNGKSHQRRIPGCHQRLLIFECCILFIFFFFFFFLILFVCSVLFRKQPM